MESNVHIGAMAEGTISSLHPSTVGLVSLTKGIALNKLVYRNVGL